MGISGAGRDAENLFCELTGAQRTTKASLGDAVLEGHTVEIKSASATTLNQVRAVKYLTLVVHRSSDGSWWVVPPHEVVKRVVLRGRGQHTENPLESATLNLGQLSEFKVDENQLGEAVIQAAEQGERYGSLRTTLKDVLADSRTLAEDAKDRVTSELIRLGLVSDE